MTADADGAIVPLSRELAEYDIRSTLKAMPLVIKYAVALQMTVSEDCCRVFTHHPAVIGPYVQ